MARLILLISIIVFLFPLLYLPPSQCSTLMLEKGVNLVEIACRRTHNQALCFSTLYADPRSIRATDIRVLAHIMLEVSLAKAKATLTYIQQLNGNASDPILKGYFNVCTGLYNDNAEKDLQSAITGLFFNNYAAASSSAYHAGEDALDCEYVFKGPPEPRKSPLTKENNLLRELSKIAGDIIYSFEK